jgi:hypothetical protein
MRPVVAILAERQEVFRSFVEQAGIVEVMDNARRLVPALCAPPSQSRGNAVILAAYCGSSRMSGGLLGAAQAFQGRAPVLATARSQISNSYPL